MNFRTVKAAAVADVVSMLKSDNKIKPDAIRTATGLQNAFPWAEYEMHCALSLQLGGTRLPTEWEIDECLLALRQVAKLCQENWCD